MRVSSRSAAISGPTSTARSWRSIAMSPDTASPRRQVQGHLRGGRQLSRGHLAVYARLALWPRLDQRLSARPLQRCRTAARAVCAGAVAARGRQRDHSDRALGSRRLACCRVASRAQLCLSSACAPVDIAIQNSMMLRTHALLQGHDARQAQASCACHAYQCKSARSTALTLQQTHSGCMIPPAILRD